MKANFILTSTDSNALLFRITHDGRWFENGEDITDDPARLRAGFEAFATAQYHQMHGKPCRTVVLIDERTGHLARQFIDRVSTPAEEM